MTTTTTTTTAGQRAMDAFLRLNKVARFVRQHPPATARVVGETKIGETEETFSVRIGLPWTMRSKNAGERNTEGITFYNVTTIAGAKIILGY